MYKTQRPKIIFFDIDDTLLVKQSDTVPSSAIDALLALKSQGIILAIATGRSLGIIPKAIQQLIDTVGIELLLTMNGQYNQYRGEKLMHFPMQPNKVQQIATELERSGIGYACMNKNRVFAFKDTKNLRTALASLRIGYDIVAFERFDFTQNIYQILAFYQENENLHLQLPAHTKTVRWHEYAVDVLDDDASKARAISQILKQFNIQPEDAAAFGDGFNDMDMFKLVGTSIAMGNAKPELKAIATLTCPRHDEDGIYHAVKSLGWIS